MLKSGKAYNRLKWINIISFLNFHSFFANKNRIFADACCHFDQFNISIVKPLIIMYTHIWLKYLPIIRILIKKSASGDQVLTLNRPDFEKAGVARKAGYKFTIEYTNGKVANVISTSQLALDLAAVML